MIKVQVNFKSRTSSHAVRAPTAATTAATTATTPPAADGWLAIGEFARRSGLAASALRFYEDQGLITGRRSAGGHRQYRRAELRRIAFVRAAQAVGLTLDEVRAALATVPGGRTPSQADWQRLSSTWQPLLDERIQALQRLRDQLSSCIGCGCLSLERCALYNPGDVIAARGAGARYLLGDRMPRSLRAGLTTTTVEGASPDDPALGKA